MFLTKMIIFIYVLEALTGLQYLLGSCQAQLFSNTFLNVGTSWETRQVRGMNRLSAYKTPLYTGITRRTLAVG